MAMLHEHDPDLHAIALEACARSMVDEWVRSQTMVRATECELTNEEYDAITAAYCSGDPVKLFQAHDRAVRRVLRALADQFADAELERKQIADRRRDDEDRAADRADFRRAFA